MRKLLLLLAIISSIAGCASPGMYSSSEMNNTPPNNTPPDPTYSQGGD